jgi:hypothetical protein
VTDGPQDEQRKTRMAYAETLAEFNDQRTWYSRKSGLFKNRSQRIDMAIICFGALIAVLPVLKPGSTAHWTAIAASFLGGLVVVSQGLQRVFRYSEIWPEYRLASERMKREWRMFVNGAEPYDCGEDEAQQRYVENLEKIIADEQKIFFDRIHNPDKTDSGGATSA